MTACCEHHSEGVRVIHSFLSTYYVPGPAHPFPRIHCREALAEPEGWGWCGVDMSMWVQWGERKHTVI